MVFLLPLVSLPQGLGVIFVDLTLQRNHQQLKALRAVVRNVCYTYGVLPQVKTK